MGFMRILGLNPALTIILPAYKQVQIEVCISCFKHGIKICCSNVPHRILKFYLMWTPWEFWVTILHGKIEKA